MPTRAEVFWALVVWSCAVWATWYFLFRYRWQRPQTMNAGWKARQ